jgi:hypothetical protein
LVIATIIVTITSALMAVVNFGLNLNIVTAVFGTELFNQQVAQVNGITRLAFPIVNIGALMAGFWLIFRAIYSHLPAETTAGGSQDDLLPAIERWHAERQGAA